MDNYDPYSLESILAEFGDGAAPAETEPAAPEPPSEPIVLNDEDDGSVSFGGLDNGLKDVDIDHVPENVSEYESIVPPEKAEFTANADEPKSDISDELDGFDDDDADDAEYAEDDDYEYDDDDDDDDDDDEDEYVPRRSVKETLGAPLIALLAYIVMKVRQSRINFRGAPPEEAEDLGDEVAPDKAVKFYDKHIPWLKLRTRLSFLITLIMAYVSFGFPVSGALNDTGVKAALLLIMLLTVMLCGLDVLVSGFAALLSRRPHANSLVALSCLFCVIDAAIIACGLKDFGIPYCAVAAGAVSFTLLSSVLCSRSSRIACRSAAVLRDPFTLTAETSVTGEGITLLKSRCGTKDFVRRTEEYGPDEAVFGLLAPYLILISLILSIIAAAVGDGFKAYAHILSGIFAFAAPFGILFSFPLPFFVSAKKLIRKGAAIAGWSGLFDIGKSKHIIISDTDLFAKSNISIEKTHILAGTSSEKVLSLAGTMISASGSALTPAFMELMNKGGGTLLRMDEFNVHEGGGLVALINGEEVLCGPAGFMQLMGIRLPKALALKDCVFLSISGVLCGFFEIRYTPSDSVYKSLLEILRSDRHPIFALRDFNMSPQMLSRKFDIPTDGFDFPSFIERYEISAASPSESSKPAALLSKDGLGPLISLAEHSRRLYNTVQLCVLLTIMSVFLGIVLAFIYFCGANFAAVGAGRVIVYMLLWLIPELISAIILGRKQM